MFRAYHFCNYYLSSIQQGIQAAHAQTEMARKYRSAVFVRNTYSTDLTTPTVNMFWEWTLNPTMICLNGGNHSDLQNTRSLLENIEFEKAGAAYPMSWFNEDEDSLAGMLTNVCIVLPEKIWGAYDALVRGQKYKYVTDRGVRTKTFGSFESFYEYASNNNGEAFSALTVFENEHGILDDWDSQLIDFVRGFRLAS